jgi:hypothetical protein
MPQHHGRLNPRAASATHFGQNQRKRMIFQLSALAAFSAVSLPIASNRIRKEQRAQSTQPDFAAGGIANGRRKFGLIGSPGILRDQGAWIGSPRHSSLEMV